MSELPDFVRRMATPAKREAYRNRLSEALKIKDKSMVDHGGFPPPPRDKDGNFPSSPKYNKSKINNQMNDFIKLIASSFEAIPNDAEITYSVSKHPPFVCGTVGDLLASINKLERPHEIKPSKIFSHRDYDDLMEDTFEEMRKLGALKGGEYAGDVDRLANFRRNGEDCELPMETIWRVYAGKHWDAITQYVKDLQQNKTRERLESISGRVDDMLVYLILFKCMIAERERTPI